MPFYFLRLRLNSADFKHLLNVGKTPQKGVNNHTKYSCRILIKGEIQGRQTRASIITWFDQVAFFTDKDGTRFIILDHVDNDLNKANTKSLIFSPNSH